MAKLKSTVVQGTLSVTEDISENGQTLSDKYQPKGSYLTTTGTAADSSKLNGQAPAYYLNYNNLTNKPTIPTADSGLTNDRYVRFDINNQGLTTTQKSNARTNIGAGTSSFSGSYNDLSNKPTIPTADSGLTNDAYVKYSAAQSLDSTQKAQARSNIGAGTSSFSGSYSDLSNKPTIPTADSGLTNDRYVRYDINNQGLSATQKTNARTNIGAGTSSFSGNYNDLTNKPTIPTVNNATLTIQKNGTTVKTFTANASTDVTANITVPTSTNDLTNDSGFITSSDIPVSSVKVLNSTNTSALTTASDEAIAGSGTLNLHKVSKTGSYNDLNNKPSLATVATSGSYSDLSNKPSIPSVGNGTLTIQAAGTSKGTFTANQSGNTTINITASDLGLSGALQFIGTTSTTLTDGSTTNPITIGSSSVTVSAGNVVFSGSKEFAWDGSVWKELGDQSSYALNTVTVTGTGALGGGGNLTTNRTITHNEVLGTAQTTAKVFKVKLDKYGHVSEATAATASDVGALSSNTTYVSSVNGSSGAVTGIATQAWVGDQGYLTSHQTIKTLDTTATTAQSTNSAETIAGSGSIKLHKVAKTGNYNDLLNPPTIPSVGNGTLTIKKNGTNVGTFTANQSTAANIDISVPTKTSDLTNDSNFITASDVSGLEGKNQKVKAGDVTFNNDAVVNFVAGDYMTVTGSTTGTGAPKITISGNYESKSAAQDGGDLSLVTTGEKYSWNNKQSKLTSQTAFNNKGSSTKVPKITTNTMGQVTNIEEVDISSAVANDGTLTIQKNSTTLGTFSANSSTSPTINISVPVSDSDLTNNAYVKFSAAQSSLTDEQKTQARNNIGAGTSSFTGYTANNKLDGAYINNTQSWTSNTGTVTGVSINGTTYSPSSGTVALPTVKIISTSLTELYPPNGFVDTSDLAWALDEKIKENSLVYIKKDGTGSGSSSLLGGDSAVIAWKHGNDDSSKVMLAITGLDKSAAGSSYAESNVRAYIVFNKNTESGSHSVNGVSVPGNPTKAELAFMFRNAYFRGVSSSYYSLSSGSNVRVNEVEYSTTSGYYVLYGSETAQDGWVVTGMQIADTTAADRKSEVWIGAHPYYNNNQYTAYVKPQIIFTHGAAPLEVVTNESTGGSYIKFGRAIGPSVSETDSGQHNITRSTIGYIGMDANGTPVYSTNGTTFTPIGGGACVRYDTNAQGLNSTQQANAKKNIGISISGFNGYYYSLAGKPELYEHLVTISSTTSGNQYKIKIRLIVRDYYYSINTYAGLASILNYNNGEYVYESAATALPCNGYKNNSSDYGAMQMITGIYSTNGSTISVIGFTIWSFSGNNSDLTLNPGIVSAGEFTSTLVSTNFTITDYVRQII